MASTCLRVVCRRYDPVTALLFRTSTSLRSLQNQAVRSQPMPVSVSPVRLCSSTATSSSPSGTMTAHEERIKEFHTQADEMLDSLSEVFDQLAEEPGIEVSHGYDVHSGAGVLTIELDTTNVFVLNKQAPNQQIWLSSPFTGPKRYNLFRARRWLTDKQESLLELLTCEMTSYFKTEVDVKERINKIGKTKWK